MWKTVKLGEIATWVRGLTYSKKDEVESNGTAVLRATNIDLSTSKLVLDGIRYVSETVKVKNDKYTKVGDLLVCTASGSKSHIGKVAIIEEDLGMAFGGFMAALRCNENCIPKFLYYVLTSQKFKRHLKSLEDGTNINNLKFSQIEDYELLLPPLAEQQRIVAKLDAAFTEIDEAITTSYKQLNNLESLYKKSLLSLFKVGIEKEMWELKPLQNYCDVVVGYVGEIASAYREPNNGVLLLSTTNIKSKGISLAKTKTVSFEFHERNKKSQLKPGDILVARHGNSGEAAEITSDIKEAQALNVIIIKKGRKIESAYLVLLLNSKVLSQIGESKAGSVQQIINTKVIKDLMIPAPPMERQVEIIGELRKLSSKVEQFKGLLNGKIVKYQTLKSAILAQELQPQKIEAA